MLQQAQICLQLGRPAEAIQLYDQMIASGEQRSETYYRRANALNSLNRWQEAIADYDRAIHLNPQFANAYCNRGRALECQLRWPEALDSYDQAIALDSADSLANYNRGCVLVLLGRLSDAAASFDRAIHLKPDYTQAYVNRGNVLQELRQHQAAITSYDQALALNPQQGEVLKSRGASRYGLKQIEAAIEDYKRAFLLVPDSKYLLGMRRHAQNQICDWNGVASDLATISSGLKQQKPVCTPFALLSLSDSLIEQRQAAEIWVRDTCPPQENLGPFHVPASHRKIRLAYFSADFRDHPVSQLTASLFEQHDRSKFEVFAFAFGPPAEDSVRDRLKRAFDQFIEVGNQSDEQIALTSRRAEIDIAVDLGGFTEYSRTRIFSLRAAPLQVNFLGYPGTMSAPYIDYIVGDRTVIPAEHRHGYIEKVICLPGSFLPNDSNVAISGTVYNRAQFGLPPSGFVYCCFNNSYKILPETFDGWMRILGRVPNSTLWLSFNNSSGARNLRDAASKRGVDAARIIFADRIASLSDHLARLKLADLFLNTHPYNAHATAVDCLKAGVPIVTRAGNTFVSRVSASLLNALKLQELVSDSAQSYEQLAIELALDEPRLKRLKSRLNQTRVTSPLFNTDRYTRGLEAGYEAIFQRHLSGLAPENVFPSVGTCNETT